MAEPFLSEIKLFSFNFAPKGFALCNGQTMSINQNQALFSLVGTTYGGNGTSNFQLPNLQGRVAVHQGSNFVIGEVTGETTHELIVQEMPVHNHLAEVGASATTNDPTNVYLATPTVNARLGSLYSSSASSTASAATIQSSGGSQPHNNLQPLLTLNYCIALVGIFPSQN